MVVESILGMPDKISASDSGYPQIAWAYSQLGITLDFSAEEDFLLGGASFEKPNFEVNGIFPVGLNEAELLAAESSALPGLVLEDEFDYLEAKNYECDMLGLVFWCTGGIVTVMTMFPRYDAGQRPIHC